MKELFYGDNRDLVKWSVLFHPAQDYHARWILQVAFLTPSEFGSICIDGHERPIPDPVRLHFRNIRDVQRMATGGGIGIEVFDELFGVKTRDDYVDRACKWLKEFEGTSVVFLDPDTGLLPRGGRPTEKHVLECDARRIWFALKRGDVFVFYQHRFRERDWIRQRKSQLEKALHCTLNIARGADPDEGVELDGIARDVVFYFAQKP